MTDFMSLPAASSLTLTATWTRVDSGEASKQVAQSTAATPLRGRRDAIQHKQYAIHTSLRCGALLIALWHALCTHIMTTAQLEENLFCTIGAEVMSGVGLLINRSGRTMSQGWRCTTFHVSSSRSIRSRGLGRCRSLT